VAELLCNFLRLAIHHGGRVINVLALEISLFVFLLDNEAENKIHLNKRIHK
jgi:hypothetical protein